MASTAQKTRGASNCTISYTKASAQYSFATRCNGLSHGFEVVSTESHARQFRAFYPHQRALSPFVIRLELMGYPELKQVMDFMRAYVKALMVSADAAMTVSVPSRNFMRKGVPIGGITDEDHTGSMVFQPAIVFESVTDPLDTKVFTTIGPNASVSTVDLGITTQNDASKFFYPPSAAVNDPNATGESLYDTTPYKNPDPGLGAGNVGGSLTGPARAF
jgi:hypothetical protein